MNRFKKIKWLMYILQHDGIPAKVLSNDMDQLEVYCILVLLARIYIHINNKSLPLDLTLSIDICRNNYARSNRGIERKRLKELRDAYNVYLFKWESDPYVSGIY